MVDNTRESSLDAIEDLGFDSFLSQIHCIEDSDLELKLYAIWCAEKTLPLSKSKCNWEYLKFAKKYLKGGVSLEVGIKNREKAKSRWRSLWDHDRRSIETAVAETIFAACTAVLSDIRSTTLWSLYNDAINKTAMSAARTLSKEPSGNLDWNTWTKIRLEQETELRRICT